MRTRITLAALALLAVGCSQNENVDTPEVQVNAKAIRVGQNVQGMTRAVASDGSNVTATVLMCDGAAANWTGFSAVSSNTIAPDGALTARANTATASFKAGTTTTVAFNPTLYYNNTARAEKSHLVAVAPAGNLAGTTVTMNAVDGEQDVMYATAVDAGSENSPTNPINLSFAHLTTQLNFKVKTTEASGIGDWDGKSVTVKSINVQSAQLPQSVNAADGSVTWNTASALTVPGINNTVLNTSYVQTGSPVMIKGESSVMLDVTLTVGGKDLVFSNVPIKNSSSSDLTTVTGNSHLISLNVTEPQTATGDGVAIIDVTATVAPWIVGNPGSADLK